MIATKHSDKTTTVPLCLGGNHGSICFDMKCFHGSHVVLVSVLQRTQNSSILCLTCALSIRQDRRFRFGQKASWLLYSMLPSFFLPFVPTITQKKSLQGTTCRKVSPKRSKHVLAPIATCWETQSGKRYSGTDGQRGLATQSRNCKAALNTNRVDPETVTLCCIPSRSFCKSCNFCYSSKIFNDLIPIHEMRSTKNITSSDNRGKGVLSKTVGSRSNN